MKIEITRSKYSDRSEVLQLLNQVALPTEGVAEHFANFFVARDGNRIIGCVGLEKHGNHALLRSLAVAPDYRGRKIGQSLTQQAIAYAEANTVKVTALLTTTADQFFARHFNFSVADRTEFEAVFSNSPEWNLPRCSSAVFMIHSLPDSSKKI